MHLITNSCQVQLFGYITKNLKLYSIAQKIKSDSLAWLGRSHATQLQPANPTAFSVNALQPSGAS